MKFLIMNGAGNRFGVFDARETPGFALSDAQTIEIAKPGGKIMGEKGADQIVILRAPKSSDADIFMEIRNQKGFEVDACGNATRTTAWLHMRDAETDICVVETNDGLLHCTRAGAFEIAVDMGPPKLEWQQIPLCVFFVEEFETVKPHLAGPMVEFHPLFPEQANVGFAKVESEDRIRLKVWERGVGMTLACGTGACAAVVAAHRQKRTGRNVTVEADGGILHIHWRETDDHVIMTGPVELESEGTV